MRLKGFIFKISNKCEILAEVGILPVVIFFAPVDSDWLVWRLDWLPFQLNLVIPTV